MLSEDFTMIMVNNKNETPCCGTYCLLLKLLQLWSFMPIQIEFGKIKLQNLSFSNVCGCLDEKPWDDVIFGRGKKEEEEHLLKKKVS